MRSSPQGKEWRERAVDWARFLMCSREIQVAQALCRGFDWHTLHLWADQCPPCTAVMLSGQDNIVPAPAVRDYLRQQGVAVEWHQDFHHAELLFSPAAQRVFLNALEATAVHA